eukprot:TRINITY_DN742_c0_g1::TRINITY_DN742_c0_g1_i2::g.18370::m.18370 TRINITY_DN742_c0_g1::TRINITY_DN742_c0_g1_i2::g.18370  ORF type:complete len:135 (+),score=-5.04,sp/P40694/SMBP2_MOUSE/44.44/3e-07 TRINITY_DN742_c0_g1_i2:160-564(+)
MWTSNYKSWCRGYFHWAGWSVKHLFYFATRNEEIAIDFHLNGRGDIVGLFTPANQDLGRGVVTELNEKAITVTFDDMPSSKEGTSSLPEPLIIRKLANDVTYQRYKRALEGIMHDRSQAHSVDMSSRKFISIST